LGVPTKSFWQFEEPRAQDLIPETGQSCRCTYVIGCCGRGAGINHDLINQSVHLDSNRSAPSRMRVKVRYMNPSNLPLMAVWISLVGKRNGRFPSYRLAASQRIKPLQYLRIAEVLHGH
jgi:hypothetical protein